MRSRAVILPFPGDPLLLHYWLWYFDNVWGGEVDKLYIYLNSAVGPDAVEYIREMCLARPKINLLYEDRMCDHGTSIDRTLDIVEEENVMLIEDDGFIFRQGKVDFAFTFIESGQYDIIGSKRGSCSDEISVRASEIWGINYLGEGDQGCNFWPCYLFIRKHLLLATDRNFNARMWKAGEEIKPLHYTAVNDCFGDTLVNTSLQLHDTVPSNRIAYLPQFHGHPDDIEFMHAGKGVFDPRASWTHVGSLSTGISGTIRDEQNRPMEKRHLMPPQEYSPLPNGPTTEFEQREWERRVQWWLSFYEKSEPDKIVDFREQYRIGLERIIREYRLSIKNIRARQTAYRSIGII